MDRPAYRRVLLKLSGEALMGKNAFGIDPEVVDTIAAEIRSVVDLGVQLGDRYRRREHLPRDRSRRPRYGQDLRRLHGNAGHRD